MNIVTYSVVKYLLVIVIKNSGVTTVAEFPLEWQCENAVKQTHDELRDFGSFEAWCIEIPEAREQVGR